jgi:20S proteasome subunit alpha 1
VEVGRERQPEPRPRRCHRGGVSRWIGLTPSSLSSASNVCATDFKATEIEIGIASTSPEETGPNPGRFRQMNEAERDEWLTRVGEKD